MGDPVTAMAVGSTVLGAFGVMQQANAADAAGKAAQQGAELQAVQMEANAKTERAAAQRKALEENRKKNIATSRAQSLAAASGGSSLDPSIVDLMGDLEAEGEYNKQVAMYEGDERAYDLRYGAGLKRYEGSQARAAGKAEKKALTVKAGANVLGGISQSSLLDKYSW